MTFIKIDLMEIPGLSCVWIGYEFSTKFQVKMLTPLVVIGLLMIPVAVAWSLSRRERKKLIDIRPCATPDAKESTPDDTKWTDRFHKTVDLFVTNLMFWLFIVFPGASFASLEIFICREIAGKTYLNAEYSQTCPWDYPDGFWNFATWAPIASTAGAYVFIYILGTPVLMMWVMMYHSVPRLVHKKICEGRVAEMIVQYVKNTSTASSQRLASYMGIPPRLHAIDDIDSSNLSGYKEFHRRAQVCESKLG